MRKRQRSPYWIHDNGVMFKEIKRPLNRDDISGDLFEICIDGQKKWKRLPEGVRVVDSQSTEAFIPRKCDVMQVEEGDFLVEKCAPTCTDLFCDKCQVTCRAESWRYSTKLYAYVFSNRAVSVFLRPAT